MKIRTSQNGFTLVEIMIVVAIIGLLAAIAIPNFIKARQVSQKGACIANLKQIDGAINTWAMETNQGNGADPNGAFNDIFGPTAYIKSEPKCPAGGTYTYLVVGTPAGHVSCTYGPAEGHTLP
jgi:prepilin-type N-terminal cleavage/methylation domain-containing protein